MLIKYCGTLHLLGRRRAGGLTTYTNAFRRYRQPVGKETMANPAAPHP
jgi:hypothetical protein